MSSTLSEGVRVPDIGSTSWGADVNFNWGLLNTALANISGNVKVDVANTWTAPQTFTETISGSIDGVAARAVGDEDGNNIKTAIATKAADNAVVHLAGAETISGDKTFTGATATHNITPEADNTYSLGSTSYQWASVYAQSYYYKGTAWGLDKANRWTGVNTFTDAVHAVTNQSVPIAENPSAEIIGNNFRFIDNDRFWGQFIPVWGTDGSFCIDLGISNWTTTGNQGYWTLSTKISKDFGTLSFYTSHLNANLGTSTNNWNTVWTQSLRAPGTSNSLLLAAMETWEDGARIFMYGKDDVGGSRIYADIDRDDGNHNKTGFQLDSRGFLPTGVSRNLGIADASYKWATFNGINPGALGLQNFNAGITLDTTNWDKTGKYGADANFWTPTVNGWLTVLVNGTPGSGWVQLSQADSLGQFSVCLSTGYAWATIPVVANRQCKICLLCSTVSAKFYPCLGNV